MGVYLNKAPVALCTEKLILPTQAPPTTAAAMTTKTLPPGVAMRHSTARSRRSASRFPAIRVPRPTMVSPDFADLHPRNRINVLHPPNGPKRTVALETGTAHLHLYNRSLDMQRKQSKREHQEWKKPFYGNPTVVEGYRSDIRSTLKNQMDEQTTRKQRQFDASLKYSISVFERDRRHTQQDSQKRHDDKLAFLLTFTKANQQIMEKQWKENRIRKSVEVEHERDLLRHNPINWSRTLK